MSLQDKTDNPFARLDEATIDEIYQRYVDGERTADLIREYGLTQVTQHSFTRLLPPKQLTEPCPYCHTASLVQLRHNRAQLNNPRQPVKECTQCDYKVFPHQDRQQQLQARTYKDLSSSDRVHLLVLLGSDGAQHPGYPALYQQREVLARLIGLGVLEISHAPSAEYGLRLQGEDGERYHLRLDDGTGQLLTCEQLKAWLEEFVYRQLFDDAFRSVYTGLVLAAAESALTGFLEDELARQSLPFKRTPSLSAVLMYLMETHSLQQIAQLLRRALGAQAPERGALRPWQLSSRLAGQLLLLSDEACYEGWHLAVAEGLPHRYTNNQLFRTLKLTERHLTEPLKAALERVPGQNLL